MDIYQIIMTHNRMWSKREIAVFSMVAVTALVVFTRTVSPREYELVPFWSWREVILYHDMFLLHENLLNCILLMPVGILLPLIAGHKVRLRTALMIGALISAVIETSQLVFMRGLFEWDDMIHNGVGCMIGCAGVNTVWRRTM